MNWKPIEGNWPNLVEKALDRWPSLSRADLEQSGGDHTKLKNLLQTKCNFSANEAEDELKTFADNAAGVPTR